MKLRKGDKVLLVLVTIFALVTAFFVLKNRSAKLEPETPANKILANPPNSTDFKESDDESDTGKDVAGASANNAGDNADNDSKNNSTNGVSDNKGKQTKPVKTESDIDIIKSLISPLPAGNPNEEYMVRVFKDRQITAVFTKDENGEFNELLHAFLCSTALPPDYETPNGMHEIGIKYPSAFMIDASYAQYSTEFLQYHYFHAPPSYGDVVEKGVSSEDFNKLGNPASHGCIRLTTRDAKWMFENLAEGTAVEVLDSSKDFPQLPEQILQLKMPEDGPTWDPTNDNPMNPYQQNPELLLEANDFSDYFATEGADNTGDNEPADNSGVNSEGVIDEKGANSEVEFRDQTKLAGLLGMDSDEAEDHASILFVGDVLIHQSLLNAADQGNDTYDFLPLFQYQRDLIAQVDLAAFDMEGVLKGPPYSGYPAFSVPESIAYDLKEVGFDLATTGNNHQMDFDYPGLKKTPENLKKAGLDVVGSRTNPDDPSFVIKTIKGMKIGITAFTYESHFTAEGYRSMNNVPLLEETRELIDSVYVQPDQPHLMEEDGEKVVKRIREMRDAGAEAIVVLFHWGTEYGRGVDYGQEYYAQILANEGVEVVIGAGPHVTQPIKEVKSEDGEHTMLCYYSVGNFVSNQQFDTGNSEGHAQDGLIALVTFARDGNEVKLAEAGYVAHTMYKTYPNGKEAEYTVGYSLPIYACIDSPHSYGLDELGLEEVKRAKERIESVLSQNELNKFEIKNFTGSLE